MTPPAGRGARHDRATRAARLAALLADEGLDQLLVTNLVNIRYLTGFSGTNALCLASAGERFFWTDFRYVERAEEEVDDSWQRIQAGQDGLVKAAAGRFQGRLGFDDDHVTVAQHRRLVKAVPEGVELVAAGGLVERVRRSKDESELGLIAEASRLADEVYEWTLERGLEGKTEREVALAAEQRLRELGAEGPSFPTIVATGANGALPHAEPGDRTIQRGHLVVLDMGALVDGYCSDCTRTFAVGEPDGEAREVYELVGRAQEAALARVAAGVAAREVDAAARETIAEAGHGEGFGHGTGHGVGLEIHEAPRLAATSEDELVAGDVVTIEPGVYLPGRLGVRTEDLVVVEAGGIRNLSGHPKSLQVVD